MSAAVLNVVNLEKRYGETTARDRFHAPERLVQGQDLAVGDLGLAQP